MNEIQKIRKKTGLSQSKFAAYFNIPVRTLQKWEIGQSIPPHYLLEMMKKILMLEQKNDVLNHAKLPENLKDFFWDCEIDMLDLNKNSAFVISRLYNFGGIEGRTWVDMFYDKKTIINAACSRRDLNPIVANYLMKVLKINQMDMAYYNQNMQNTNWGRQ